MCGLVFQHPSKAGSPNFDNLVQIREGTPKHFFNVCVKISILDLHINNEGQSDAIQSKYLVRCLVSWAKLLQALTSLRQTCSSTDWFYRLSLVNTDRQQ